MDIRRLEAFSKVFELRSFSKAGLELFLSQPTISAHVSSLESELGVRLFDRLGRGILPTTAANVLYRHAQEVFRSLDVARAELQLLQERVSGELALGGSTIPAHYMLPRMLADFMGRYPDITLHMTVGDTEDVATQVADGEILVGMVGGRTGHPDLRFDAVLEDELVVIATPELLSRSGRPATGKALTGTDIMHLPWVVREAGSGTRRAFDSALSDKGLDPRRLQCVIGVESTQATLQCVAAGLGFGITSRLAADRMLSGGELVVVPVEGLDLVRTFFLVHNERRHLFPVVRYFIDFVMGGDWRVLFPSNNHATSQ